jgi:hypothetical protein
MGITSAPPIFDEVTFPMVRYWRTLGIRVMKSADDFPSAAESFLIQKINCQFMVEHMHSLGWFLKDIKLIGYPDPIPEIFALGTLISFTYQRFQLRPDQIQQILLLTQNYIRFVLAKSNLFTPSRSHHIPCLGPAARMRTRAMYTNMRIGLSLVKRSFP